MQAAEKKDHNQDTLSYAEARQKAEEIVTQLTLEEKIEFIGGHDFFFVKGDDRFHIPSLYLSDATQGVHIRDNLPGQLEKSTAFPCPVMLAATWNTSLANKYAQSIGEECRAGGIAVLLGPGMNIYRNSQCGRNFEYFGEDPYLAARMIENYVKGVQSTGTIATLKHFVANNTDFHRRRSNSIVDERTLHEIYLPAFKAGIDAGARAVMTAYNQVNGEWAGQSNYVIQKTLREDLGFKWLVMSDWWSVWDAEKAIKSGLDLEMPGHTASDPKIQKMGCAYLRLEAKKLIEEGKIKETDIDRMVTNILTTIIATGLQNRPVKDERYKENFTEHEQTALQTAREGIVLLKNDAILPFDKTKLKKILVTGDYLTKLARGGGSAEVEGYNNILLLDALTREFGIIIDFKENPADEEIKAADVIIISIGSDDHEGWDMPFALPEETNNKILHITHSNPNTVVIVNSGRGVQMAQWNDKVKAIIYAWYPGQNGNIAIAEVLSGKTNPSGKLPISIEKKFEDSPAYPYIPEGQQLYSGWAEDNDMTIPINQIQYDEGIFTGYRWYDSKAIDPLYPFGHGLSYTSFDYSDLILSSGSIKSKDTLTIAFSLTNNGSMEGTEVTQLYIQDVEASVPRPVKELKGFEKVNLKPGESKKVYFSVKVQDLAYWDVNTRRWVTEPGKFKILIGSSSKDIRLTETVEYIK
ncbi:MAG: glycoside hydrolase family 3 C-terminal domain-containing protein [Bacteroidales bacterium]|nr:glycoside hydrolase family 3 C-terminal domain-containing protein [Bacteroidales bacterium]